MREALFSMVGDLGGSTVLDAFAGSGMLGLEAWSRGATVTAVERDPRRVRIIGENVGELGATVIVRQGDALRLPPSPRFDVVLADPPYAWEPAPVVEALGPLTVRWLVLETPRDVSAPTAGGGVVLDRHRVYGGTALWLYRRAEAL